MNDTAHIRLVLVNFNGGDMTRACVESLRELDWPPSHREIVVVDNASTDGIADVLEARFPDVRVIRSTENLGFAGGMNLALTDLDGVDFVALVNNDAVPARDWLHPLVTALRAEEDLGAACPKIVLMPRFVEVRLDVSRLHRPGGLDPRTLGVMIRGLMVNGRDVTGQMVFADGAWGWEHDAGGRFQWTREHAVLWCPFAPDEPPPTTVTLDLEVPQPTGITLTGSAIRRHEVGGGRHRIDVDVDGLEPFDVINNAGSRLVAGGWAGDRGFMARDDGQFSQPEEVFAWCGAAALLRKEYVEELNGFDGGLFLYYEDTDMAWRGRLRGWRYRYVPDAVVRHMHSATSGEGSSLFNHYVDRNRLLVFTRNAPARAAVTAWANFVRETGQIALRDVIRPTVRRGTPSPRTTRQKLRSLAAATRHLPRVMRSRMQERPNLRRSRAAVSGWATRP